MTTISCHCHNNNIGNMNVDGSEGTDQNNRHCGRRSHDSIIPVVDDENDDHDTSTAEMERDGSTQHFRSTSKHSCGFSTKRRRVSLDDDRSTPTFDCLPTKAVQCILQFVDVTPRQLFNITTSIKPFHLAIQTRPDIVIKNAFLHDGNAQHIVTGIVDLVSSKSIVVPSTMRLLRLINGTSCENGDDCFGFDLITRKSSQDIKSTSRPFGLCLCMDCMKALALKQCSIRIDPDVIPSRYKKPGISECLSGDYCSRLLREYFFEKITGRHVGPLLNGTKLSQLISSNPRSSESYTNPKVRSAWKAKLLEGSTQQLEVVLESFGNYDAAAHTIISAYHDAKKVKKQRDMEISALAASRRANMADTSKLMVKELLERLNELATAYGWMFHCIYRGGEGMYRAAFEVGFVDRHLGQLIRCPSGATKKKIAIAIMGLVKTIGKLEKASILPVSGQPLGKFFDETSQFGMLLARYYRKHYCDILRCATAADIDILHQPSRGRGEETIWRLVKDRCPTFFEKSVTSEKMPVNNFKETSNRELFGIAKSVLAAIKMNPNNPNCGDQTVAARYLFFRSKYIEFLTRLRNFRVSKLLSDYIGSRYLPESRPKHREDREMVANYIFTLASEWQSLWIITPIHNLVREASEASYKKLLSFVIRNYQLRKYN